MGWAGVCFCVVVSCGMGRLEGEVKELGSELEMLRDKLYWGSSFVCYAGM